MQPGLAERLRIATATMHADAERAGIMHDLVRGRLRRNAGQFRGVSERKLIDCLTRLGRDVQIVVKEAPRRRAEGKLTVVFA